MNDATTATAIFPFIGMNRSTNPINQDHIPNPFQPAIVNTLLKNQPPPTSTPAPPDNPRSAPPTRPTANDGHQPDNRKSGNRRADPGPVPDQPPPHPSTKSPHPPRKNTRATIAAEGRSSQHRPTAASPIETRRTTSAAPRQPKTRTRGTGSPTTRSTPESPRSSASTPRGKHRAQARFDQSPDYPQQGNQPAVSTSRNRSGASTRTQGCVLSIPKHRSIPARAGCRKCPPDDPPCVGGSQLQHANLKRVRSIPAHAGREHNEEVDRRADAGSGDQQRTPSNTPATGDTPIRPSTPREA